MQNPKATALLAALLFISLLGRADTLTFIAQPDVNQVYDYSWFNINNWFRVEADGSLVPVGRPPREDDTAIVTGRCDASSTVRLNTLILTNYAALNNGTFSLEDVQMLDGSSFSHSTIYLLSSMVVGGTNCTFTGVTLNIMFTATASVSPVAPATAATLTLNEGSLISIGGRLSLADASQVLCGTPPQSTIRIGLQSGLASTGQALVRGSATHPLIIDNSGTVSADSGTLRFEDSIDWQSSEGLGTFQAAAPDSLLLFVSPFEVEAGVTSVFTGPGTNRFVAGGTIEGIAQVASPGNLELLDTLSGPGSVHVLGGQSASLAWYNGLLAVTQVAIDPGGNMSIAGTDRQLSGCDLENGGLCTLLAHSFSLTNGATITNLAGGTFEVPGEATFSGGLFNNAGTFRKSGTGTMSFAPTSSTAGADFNNTGLVDILGGQLNLLGGVSSGEFRTAAGAVLWFPGGTHTLSTGASFTGAGPVQIYQGVTAPKWLINGPISVALLQVGTNGTIEGSTGAPGAEVRIQSLVLSNSAVLKNGTFSLEQAQMLGGSMATGSALTVSKAIAFGSPSCELRNVSFTILPTAVATLSPGAPASVVTLPLSEGSVIHNQGQIALGDGAQLIAGGLPQSKLELQQGGLLSSTGAALVRGAIDNHLIIDNNGTVRVQDGTLRFEGGIDWQSSRGSGTFAAAAPTATLLFASAFQVSAGKTNAFVGPGLHRWGGGATIDGWVQVGAYNPADASFNPGNLELAQDVGGTGRLRVLGSPKDSSRLTWSKGILTLAAVDLDPGAQMFLTETGLELGSCLLNNAGFCAMLSDRLTLYAGAVINILPSGLFEVQTNCTFAGASLPAGGAFWNAGTFRVSTPSTAQFGQGVPGLGPDFNNSGLVDVRSGQLNLFGGLSTGQFQVATGTVLWFWGGNHTLNTGATFSGSGLVRLAQGLIPARWVINGPTTVATLELGDNGIIDGPGALIVTNSLAWKGGTMQGVGSLDLAPSASLNLSGVGAKTLLQRTINNRGSITWLGSGPLLSGLGAWIDVLPGGVFDIQTDAVLTATTNATRLTIQNGGSFLKSAGNGQSGLAADFYNAATFRVSTGSVLFDGSWTQESGSAVVDAGAVLGAPLLDIQGGTLAGPGLIDANVNNGGSLSTGVSPGILTLGTGKDYVQKAAGALLLQIGGRTAGTQHDQFAIPGAANLNGRVTINLINGFAPRLGDTFPILTCASRTGAFSSIGPDPTAGSTWLARYSDTNVTLILVPVPIAIRPTLQAGRLSFPINTEPGVSYLVQVTGSLSAPDWQTLTAITGDGTLKTVTDNFPELQRFYRVLIQW